MADPQTAIIDADVVATFSFAAYQNSVPVIRSLTITNQSESTQYDLTLTVEAVPAFVRPKQWHIDRLHPGESLEIRDCDLNVDSAFLSGLNEAERAELRFHLKDNITELAANHVELRALSKDEWGGFGSAGELLAAFVMPNDRAISRLLKQASNILAANNQTSSLEGYQSGQCQRAYLQIAAVWSALTAEGLTYANPPRSFETQGQKTRSPESILQDRLATCLDSSLLLAAAIEALGLNPVIVLRNGHCFVGGWLRDMSFPTIINTDSSEVRKAIHARDLVVFESTLATQQPPGRLEQAIREANAQLSESEEHSFVAAIDIARARMAGIKPLASHHLPVVEDEPADQQPAGPVPLADVPDFDEIPDDQVEEKPTTADGRIERWQRKLLDLSLRNRLLNFKDTKQTIPICCPDIAALEDHLASGKSVKIISTEPLNSVEGRDSQIHRRRTGDDVLEEFVRCAWKNHEIVSDISERELAARLTNVYRSARSDIAEGGSNTLYMAVGFLRWKQKPTDEKSYRAPLLLLPIKLIRQSAASPYKISLHEDEVRFNATLIQLLKKDFALDLTEFETELPCDEHGVNVSKILQRVRRLIRDAQGFEVAEELALGTFSFVKYLLWKDLVDRLAELEKNPVVRHLIREPEKVYREHDRAYMPASRHIDTAFEPKELMHPLPADSSQLAAVMAAARGHDFVLIGPPGTGKSQTIANMISQCLAEGKTVLFVAEKTAALDVVHRRLCEHGLRTSCLELHSNKSERKQFLEQLRQAWESKAKSQSTRWNATNTKLKARRDQLNRYVAELHCPDPSGWTIFRAMGRIVRDVDLFAPELDWPSDTHHDAGSYERISEVIRNLGITFDAVEITPNLSVINQTSWSVRWEQDLLDSAGSLKEEAAKMREQTNRLLDEIGMRLDQIRSLEDLRAVVQLGRKVKAAASVNCRWMFDKEFSKFQAELGLLETAIGEYKQAREKLSGQYDDATIPDIPIKDLENRWREAVSKFWPLSFFAKLKIRKLLATYSSGGRVDVQQDLAPLAQLQRSLTSISGNLLADKVENWQGPQTDVSNLKTHLNSVEITRQVVMGFGKRFKNLEAVSRKLGPMLVDASGNHPGIQLFDAFLAQTESFFAAIDRMHQLCCKPFGDQMEDRSDFFGDLIMLADGLQNDRVKLRSWTAWCAVRQQARDANLNACIEVLESGAVHPDDIEQRFELAYARWWLPIAIDRSEALRSFQGFQHEDAIREFRKLDDEARRLAALTVSYSARHDLPPEDGVPQRSELGLLRHQMHLQRPSKAIREVIAGMPNAFSKLSPCVLMSPLSIAQYLPADHPPFDVVIFDEASQITTWDAIGAIARGRQTIVVGDPKQLPPTNFFGRNDNTDADDSDEHQQDLESILDETKAAGLPVLDLRWHYRSRHESLIAFSNYRYYDNQLITFPSADLEDCGVQFQFVADGIYDRGTSRTNKREAEQIVDEAVRRMTEWLRMPEDQRLTLGVVTFNQTQQTLIQDLFDQALRENPELEWYFSDDRIEPTVVKNLENVQGDERDVIMFSITYGKDSAGAFYRNFGALNNAGGERRLNVAVTRARQLLLVYASFTADQLDIQGLNSRGVIDLKQFLQFAQRGAKALAVSPSEQQGELGSPFEEAVAAMLESKGWQVVPQVGVSRFRIDLGIIHPHRPGCFLAGIECDGATYHRSATARDRDKIREQVLRNLGWEIIRIWSPDWWYDKLGAAEKLDSQLKAILNADLQTQATAETDGLPTELEAGWSTGKVGLQVDYVPSPDGSMMEVHSGKATYQIESASELRYQACDVEAWETCPEKFYDSSYDEILKEMLKDLISVEGPIHEDLIAQKVARSHGWTRTGKKIKQRVRELLTEFPSTEEGVGTFYWSPGSMEETIAFRAPACDDERRSFDQIAMAELRGAIKANAAIMVAEDVEQELGRALGFNRITNAMRARLAEAIGSSQEVDG